MFIVRKKIKLNIKTYSADPNGFISIVSFNIMIFVHFPFLCYEVTRAPY